MEIQKIIFNLILSLGITTLIFCYFVNHRHVKSLEWSTKVMSVSIKKKLNKRKLVYKKKL